MTNVERWEYKQLRTDMINPAWLRDRKWSAKNPVDAALHLPPDDFVRLAWDERMWRDLGDTLNDLGAQGWELVAVVREATHGNEFYSFKRRLTKDD